MDESIPDKSYFRIGEVGRLLKVQPYVVRYWESEFKTVRPIRTRSDQRLYRRRDVEELMLIRKLLYEENFTINGARKQLRKIRNEEPIATPFTGGGEHDALLVEIEKGLRQIREIVD
jgi:DNA-binding transcriptional MerR regulator